MRNDGEAAIGLFSEALEAARIAEGEEQHANRAMICSPSVGLPLDGSCDADSAYRRAERSTARGGTVQPMASRPLIDLHLTIDGGSTESETTCTWAGAHVLTVHTVIPRADLALELHSTFIGHAGISTHMVHLTLGPPGRSPTITAEDHAEDHLDPTHSPRTCAYEHAQHLIEVLADLGYRASVNVPDDRAFEGLERLAPRRA